MHKFLIDECLSPRLASHARARGYSALHVNWLDKSGYPDHALMPFTIGGDYIFVTNNGADFKPIFRALDVHPGLVILLPSLPREDQIRMFSTVIDRIEQSRDLVNKLIEVDADCVVTIVDWPPDLSNRPDD